jgi:hypothetical protein
MRNNKVIIALNQIGLSKEQIEKNVIKSTDINDKSSDLKPQRDEWASNTEFVLAGIGYAVGNSISSNSV